MKKKILILFLTLILSLCISCNEKSQYFEHKIDINNINNIGFSCNNLVLSFIKDEDDFLKISYEYNKNEKPYKIKFNENSLNFENIKKRKIDYNIEIHYTNLLSIKNLHIKCIELKTHLNNQHFETLYIKHETGDVFLDTVKIKDFFYFKTYYIWFKTIIVNSNINNLYFDCEKSNIEVKECIINNVDIKNNYGHTEFLKNSFNELNYNSINGKIFMELDPNYGYTFDYNIKSYWSAFEPDQSNPGYYLYGDGERKVNVDAPKGDMEIVKYR